MSWADVASTVRARAATTLGATVAIYDNAPHTDPGDVTWVRVSFLPGESRQVQLGTTATYRTPGLAKFKIHVPLEQGDAAALALADTIKLAFRRVTVSSVTFRTPYLRNLGRDGDSWSVVVDCPFISDETAA